MKPIEQTIAYQEMKDKHPNLLNLYLNKMKKFITIFVIALLISCSADDSVNTKNCDCDRVTQSNEFNLSGKYFVKYTTVNDCTFEQKQREYISNNPNTNPKIGDCK